MNVRHSLTAFALAAVAITITLSPRAFAANVGFACGAGTALNGTLTTSNCPVGTTAFSKWVQTVPSANDFTVSNRTAVDSGSLWNWVPTTGGGYPTPGLETASSGSNQLSVVEGNSLFDFDSIDLKGDFNSYTIKGYTGLYDTPADQANDVLQFTISCTRTETSNPCDLTSWTQINAGADSDIPVNSIVITLTVPSEDDEVFGHLDNIDVTPVATPEPGTLLLLGSGLSALAFAFRRRLSA
jgi:hypothetical protein